MQTGNLIFKNEHNPCKLREVRGIICKNKNVHCFSILGLLQKAPKDAFVMLMIIFCDGTVIDGVMCKLLEPYSFTLAIFWQSVRVLPYQE